jgi:hypothetical protein
MFAVLTASAAVFPVGGCFRKWDGVKVGDMSPGPLALRFGPVHARNDYPWVAPPILFAGGAVPISIVYDAMPRSRGMRLVEVRISGKEYRGFGLRIELPLPEVSPDPLLDIGGCIRILEWPRPVDGSVGGSDVQPPKS